MIFRNLTKISKLKSMIHYQEITSAIVYIPADKLHYFLFPEVIVLREAMFCTVTVMMIWLKAAFSYELNILMCWGKWYRMYS